MQTFKRSKLSKRTLEMKDKFWGQILPDLKSSYGPTISLLETKNYKEMSIAPNWNRHWHIDINIHQQVNMQMYLDISVL